MTVLGLLPDLRGGLGELARTGQHRRFIDGYLRPYARAFAEVRYFSYLRETLAEYTTDDALAPRVRLYPGRPGHPWLSTLLLAFRQAAPLGGCGVLRVFQTTGALPAVLTRRRAGVPFVTTYGFPYARFAGSAPTALLRRLTERVTLAAADAVIVTTTALAEHVTGRVDPTRVHLIPNGVDTTCFRPGPRPARPRGHILFVGRLVPQKNLGVLVDALGRLGRHRPVRLTLVGGGPLREGLRHDARARGVPLEILPAVPHDRLPALLDTADVFVLPSLREGHPKALLEAMSAGVPCVASDAPGNRDVLVDGETGLLFDPARPDALAEAIEAVLGSPSLAARLGEQARAFVVERHDLAALVAREVALLRAVAGSRRPA